MQSPLDLVHPRLATAGDAHDVSVLLHDFNTEFSTPSPGVEVLSERLTALLAGWRSAPSP